MKTVPRSRNAAASPRNAVTEAPDAREVGGDLDAVRVFVEVARAGGFTAAAQRLDMPKSTVSRRVSELEERLGVRLLQRTTRSVSLSDAGTVYFSRAERALSELFDAEAALGELQATPRGLLRVTAPVDLGELLLASVIASYQRDYPETSVFLDLDNRQVDLVAEGYDLALRASPKLDDSSLVSRKLFTTPHGLVASPRYLDARGCPRTPDELSHHDLLLFRSPRFRSRLRVERDDRVLELDVRARTVSTVLGFLLPAASEALGIAALPLFMCAAALRDGHLVRVLPDYQTGKSHLYAVYPSSRHLSPNVRAFLDLTLARSALLDRLALEASAVPASQKASANERRESASVAANDGPRCR